MTAQNQPDVVGAFTKMRQGLLYILIGWVLLGISLVVVAAGVFAAAGPHMGAPLGRVFVPVIGALISALALILIGGVLALVGFYLKFIPGTSDLARVNSEFSTSTKLIKLGYVWGLVVVLVGAAFLPFLTFFGFAVIILGGIIIILGNVGMVVLCLKLNNVEGDSLYLISGILLIAGILLPILVVVGLILLYIALGDSVRKHSAVQKPTPV